MKKYIIIMLLIIIVIVILSFIIPVRKEEEWLTIYDPNPPGFFGAGAATLEKYEVYYNIYGFSIKQNATGEIIHGPC